MVDFKFLHHSSYPSSGPAYLIELVDTCERLHHGIGIFPWASDLKYHLVGMRSSKSITNDRAEPLTHW